MKLRLAAPELLVDLAKIDSLKGIRDDGDAIVIGAMTPHFEVVRDPLVAEHASLIADASRLSQTRKSGIVAPLAGPVRTRIQRVTFPRQWWPWTPSS